MPNAMKRERSNFFRITLVGGIIFLVPVLLIAVILRAGFHLATAIAQPVIAWFPEILGGRIVAADVIAVIALLSIAFGAGLFARTTRGERVMRWFENSLLGSLPQFQFVRSIAADMGQMETIDVVLVPSDAGWSLAFVFEACDGPWQAVYIPSAPDWTSGAVAWAHTDNIRPADITFLQAVMALRRLGAGSVRITEALRGSDDQTSTIARNCAGLTTAIER